MARLRLIIILLTLWLITLFNIERYDALGINIPTAVYVASAAVIVSVLVMPEFVTTRWYIFLAPGLSIYAVLRYPSITTSEFIPAPIALLFEMLLIMFAYVIGRWLSTIVIDIENTYDALVENEQNLRILSGVAGEEIFNQELFRARRYDRPVAVLYIKSPSLKQLEKVYDKHMPYQIALQHRYLRARIAQLAESMLYTGDPMAWYGDDIVVCLPETLRHEAEELGLRIARVISFTLNIDVAIGCAGFPGDGLIFNDLAEAAHNNLKYYLSERQVFDDTGPMAPIDPDALDSNLPAAQSTSTLPYRPDKAEGSLFKRLILRVGDLLRDLYNQMNGRADLLPPQEIEFVDTIEGKPFYNPGFWVNRIPQQSASARQIYRYSKRLLDLTLIVLASPLIVLVCGSIALLIYLEDRGPVIYSQPRTGRGGHPFRIYKFRSMIVNADTRAKEMGITRNERGETVDKDGNKLTRDPRITRIGRIIRKTSLDELPQLWNIVRGEMSLVGPRPTTFGLEKYTLFHTERLNVKPGLTGLWQIYDRGDTDFDNRLMWDIKYIDKMCLSVDIQILFRTFTEQILKRRGA